MGAVSRYFSWVCPRNAAQKQQPFFLSAHLGGAAWVEPFRVIANMDPGLCADWTLEKCGAVCRRENGGAGGAALEHAYSAPVRVLRVRPLVDDSTLGQAFADLPDISEASRSLEAGRHAGGAQSTGAARRVHVTSPP